MPSEKGLANVNIIGADVIHPMYLGVGETSNAWVLDDGSIMYSFVKYNETIDGWSCAFRFFYGLYPHLHKKLAIAIIYFPTFVFWSSGILKDPVCAAMMGYLSFALYSLIINKESVLKNTLVAVTAAYVLGVVKSYILVSYLPFLLLFILLLKLKIDF